MPFNKKRSYDLLKSNKKSTLSSGTFTKKNKSKLQRLSTPTI